MNESGYKVTIDVDLEDLIPGFLENRKQEITEILKAIESSNCEKLQSIGHSLKGVGGGYGFMKITELGAAIEDAAKRNDLAAAKQYTDELSDYINNVNITYE